VSVKKSKKAMILVYLAGIASVYLFASFVQHNKDLFNQTTATNDAVNGLTPSNFSSTNISQWTNDAGYLKSVNFNQTQNGEGIYMDYRPNNTACTNNQILLYDATNKRWVCGNTTGNGAVLPDNLLQTNSAFNGDISGVYSSIIVRDDSHEHTSATISGLNTGDFSSPNISQWANDANFISGVNFGQITNGTNIYLDYRPNNTPCLNSQVLKYDTTNNRWSCADDSGGSTISWGGILGDIADQADLSTALANKLDASTVFGGDIAGTYNNISVTDDSHLHTSASISGLVPANFTSTSISQWANDAGYITELDVSQVANGTGKYLDYRPNNIACSNNQFLKYDAANLRWICTAEVTQLSEGAVETYITNGAINLATTSTVAGALIATQNWANGQFVITETDPTLATWAGTNFITNVGTIQTGVWNGTPISSAYILDNSLEFADFAQNGCTDAQTIKWNPTLGHWVCGTDNAGAGAATWGTISGTLSDQTDLSTALGNKLDNNASFGGDTSEHTIR
jgi:hypothetical protein